MLPVDSNSGLNKKLHSAFQSVFDDPYKLKPFRPTINVRGLIYPSDYQLSPENFMALSSSAKAEGDKTVFLSVLGGSSIKPKDPTDWLIDLNSPETYLTHRGYHIAVDNAVFSPKGVWGIVMIDGFALVGGSKNFIEVLNSNLKTAFENQLAKFIDNYKNNEESPDWARIMRLFEHLFGKQKSEELLKSINLP